MVEFALILFPLLTLVAGIIYFGIGLNYWLDMNRIANQGARWAVVNNWAPECLRTDTTCTQHAAACSGVARTRVKLQNTLKCMATTKGLQDGVTVNICYPGGHERRGRPGPSDAAAAVQVLLHGLVGITLTAKATMRLEQPRRCPRSFADNGGVCT